ncbi:helix-turn-helix domain-containing protein [Bailinhaonella thermotolerans]|uniref:Helix-turn-helix domain-containing protein n=1 Tax=Bailinhaonella thermotolerans TaxID=1070861 RepID=A0A3A4AXL1_9ACTN|nr:helix-turn-helix domain-containing protein [Bailinhaonella thermotolerans]RJL30010.1 helix-turn-helix domain-containing protein [Bailinhaonella thermotolerans]
MLILDTDTLPPRERAEAFHHALTDDSVPNDIVHEEPGTGIRARLEVWRIGGLGLLEACSTGFELHRTERHVRRQRADPVVSVSLQLSGVGRAEVAGRRMTFGPDDITIFHELAPRVYGWSGSGSSKAMVIGMDRVGMPVEAVVDASLRLRVSPLYSLVLNHLRELWRDPGRVAADPGAPAVADATVELVRALLASAQGGERPGLTRSVMEETLLTRILAHARERLADPGLTPERIAAEHAISVRHLYAVLGRAGISLEQWIISERLERAREALASRARDHLTIAAIARRWGFATASHFTRRFREAYGMTPGEWRRLRRDGAGPDPGGDLVRGSA